MTLHLGPTSHRRLLGFPGMVWLLVTAALLAGCRASPGEPGQGGESERPSPRASAAGGGGGIEGADLVGTFGGDEQLEGGCAWIDAEDGQRYEVIYPAGWTVRFGPLELTDPDGAIRATEGDRIGVTGAVAEDRASICQIGPIFQATDVLTED